LVPKSAHLYLRNFLHKRSRAGREFWPHPWPLAKQCEIDRVAALKPRADEQADCGSYYEDIAGQWCGDVTDYVFTPNTLTVKFHDNRPANVFKITKYTYTNNSVSIEWLNGPKESVTVFAEFSRSKMAQQQVGDLPRRAFHRC
jgi:hypothetical protein